MEQLYAESRGGKLPDNHEFRRRQAPILHAMSLEEIVANA
jgi:hypothetical protein